MPETSIPTSPDRDPGIVVAGYNHDIPCRGETYHVQTEYLAPEGRSQITTEIYRQGQIVASHRSRWDTPPNSESGRQQLVLRMRTQHKTAIQCLLSDNLDKLALALERVTSTRRRGAQAGRPPGASGMPKMARVTPHHSGSQDLGLRRALMRLVRAVGAEPPEGLSSTIDRLRSITNAIAVLLNHEGQMRLRRDDLAELMMVRSETAGFLLDAASVEQGLALWHRYAELAEPFAAINRRRPLWHHDHEVLNRVLTLWSGLTDLEQPPEAVALALLRTCWGRDQALDELLDDPRSLTVGRLLPEVLRISESLGRSLIQEDGEQRDLD